MHLVTFIFVNIEIVILFYLMIYKLARPEDKTTVLNIILIFLLVIYNITGGLLPDPKLPGSFLAQESIAYATGFLTPCYFPYYIFKAFGLEKMKFHAYKGVYLFLAFPYFIFVFLLATSSDLDHAKNLLALPIFYALWVIYSLLKAIKYKYGKKFKSKESKEEVIVLIFSITPWIGLPVIAYFDLSQSVEASITNTGFLLLFFLQVSRHIRQTRIEHERLMNSEHRLLNWNTILQYEVEKRTRELKRANEEKTNTFINLVHETKTPLTLVNNYLEEYIEKYGSVAELEIIKGGINKLTKDVTSLFDIERFRRGIEVYHHNQKSNFSQILKNNLVLFNVYCQKKNIECRCRVEENIFIKADPNAIDRITNNLIENAIKFSEKEGKIEIKLKTAGEKVQLSVKDTGIGITHALQKKIFEPYFQINHKKLGLQGMGLGLPIVKKVVESLGGQIQVESSPDKFPGTAIHIILNKYNGEEKVFAGEKITETKSFNYNLEYFDIADTAYHSDKQTILLVEDQMSLLKFLSKKLSCKYNVFCSLNGADALKKLCQLPAIPDLILSDIMMDKLDGFAFAKAISDQDSYNHIPIIFLTAKSNPTDRLKGLRLGALDFIQKPFSFEILKQKIETILTNISKQKRAIINSSISNLQSLNNLKTFQVDCRSSMLNQSCKLYNLTTRETEIIQFILKGITYKMIGKTLFIAEKTVAKHVENIFQKVGVSNRIQLINRLHISQ